MKTITELTETELKSLAYDQIKLLRQTEINIKYIEEELQKRKELKDIDTKQESDK